MSATPNTVAAINAVMIAWHQRMERTAVLAARLGLSVDDGVIFTRHSESAPGHPAVPVGWRFTTATSSRVARNPTLARITDPDAALDAITAMVERTTSPLAH